MTTEKLVACSAAPSLKRRAASQSTQSILANLDMVKLATVNRLFSVIELRNRMHQNFEDCSPDSTLSVVLNQFQGKTP
jgi:hypothetical protein